MKKVISTFLIASVLLTSACQGTGQNGQVNKADMGTILGGVGGAVIGSSFGKGNGRVVGTAIGTLLGAGLGRSIGQSMDDVDMMKYEQTSQSAMERNKVGQSSTWRNPDSGNYGTVTPTRTYDSASGDYCREYNQTITVGGKTEKAYGTACRQPDGSWKVTQ